VIPAHFSKAKHLSWSDNERPENKIRDVRNQVCQEIASRESNRVRLHEPQIESGPEAKNGDGSKKTRVDAGQEYASVAVSVYKLRSGLPENRIQAASRVHEREKNAEDKEPSRDYRGNHRVTTRSLDFLCVQGHIQSADAQDCSRFRVNCRNQMSEYVCQSFFD